MFQDPWICMQVTNWFNPKDGSSWGLSYHSPCEFHTTSMFSFICLIFQSFILGQGRCEETILIGFPPIQNQFEKVFNMADGYLDGSSPRDEPPSKGYIESPTIQGHQEARSCSNDFDMELSPVVEAQDVEGYVVNASYGTTTKEVTTAENLQDMIDSRARKDGLRNSLKAIVFLGRMMMPMTVMAVLMFGIFSLLSWLIPHVLCKSFGEALSV